MKVVTVGPEIEDWTEQVLCVGYGGSVGCGATLEITADDIGQTMVGAGYTTGFITCPICKNHTEVTPPVGILQRLTRRRREERGRP